MFNLKSQKNTSDLDLLKAELRAFDICRDANGYRIKIGDGYVSAKTLKKALEYIQLGTKELIEHLYDNWRDLDTLANRIIQEQGNNSGNIDNLLFLNSAKKSFQLSTSFPDLKPIQQTLKKLFDTDITQADDHLIKHFNFEYISIQSLHRLIMNELYRAKIVRKMSHFVKAAQISGPWANLDLPMKERVWEWDEGEDQYFADRKKSREEQIRYNPENQTSSGFYYVWNDVSTEPYKFEDMKEDSPYKSRHSLTIG